ncbi:frizzled-5-like [Brevipalpus obovatus]|uniref:frizzled-5-like n=1 Tax=Brevipalpus obovatus TaxID=246614 RepID=UPI003D9E1605
MSILCVPILYLPLILFTSFLIIQAHEKKCEEITVPMCRGIGYNMTVMPNQFHQEKQEEAGLEVHQFWPLVQIKCSNDLQFFLCSIYTPICMDDYHESLPACRSVCERAKHGCLPVMKKYGFQWPEHMDCKNFPLFGNPESLCMDQQEGKLPDHRDTPPPPFDDPRILKQTVSPSANDGSSLAGLSDKLKPTDLFSCRCACRPPLVKLNGSFDTIQTGGVLHCAKPCQGLFYSRQDQNVASKNLSMMAFACLLCSTLVVVTFLVDRERFRYPERAIISIAACYTMVSIGHLVHTFIGYEKIACDGSMVRYSVFTPGSQWCITVFILTFYFSNAASIWWVVMTITWFLSTGLQWGSEPLSKYSLYFHLASWMIPGVESFIALASGAFDAEPFGGICSIGNQDVQNLYHFVILPTTVYLSIGFIFLSLGFVSLFRIRRIIRSQVRSRSDKHGIKSLVLRVFMFSLLYLAPSIIILVCNWFEYYNRTSWERSHNCQKCATGQHISPPQPMILNSQDSINFSSLSSITSSFKPSLTNQDPPPFVSVHLSKYFAQLAIGIATLFWMLAGEGINIWSKCFIKCFCCGKYSSHPHPVSLTQPINSHSLSRNINSQRNRGYK